MTVRSQVYPRKPGFDLQKSEPNREAILGNLKLKRSACKSPATASYPQISHQTIFVRHPERASRLPSLSS
jgi:hypothetical protein